MKTNRVKEIARKMVAFWDVDKTKVRFYPQRDWYILFVVMFFLIVVLVLANLWFLSLIDNEKIFVVAPTEGISSEVIDLDAFQETTERFDIKKEKLETLLKTKPVLVDPSV